MRYLTEKQFSREMKRIQSRNKQIELRNQLKKERKKARLFSLPKVSTSNKVLITAIVAVLLFSIACLYIQYVTSVEVSSTLITLWYSFWTVEIVSLAGIKVTKVIKYYKDSNSEEENSTDDDSEAVG